MKINLKAMSFDAHEVPFKNDAVLMIRPYPRSRQSARYKNTGDIVLTGEDQLDRFNYCLTGWKGVADDAGNAIALTDEVKKAIFDANWEGVADFVLRESRKREEEMAASEKN